MAANPPSSFTVTSMWNDIYGQATVTALEVNQLQQSQNNSNRLQNFELPSTFPLYGEFGTVPNETSGNWPIAHASYNNNKQMAYANGSENFVAQQQILPMSLPTTSSNEFASSTHGCIIPPSSTTNLTANDQHSLRNSGSKSLAKYTANNQISQQSNSSTMNTQQSYNPTYYEQQQQAYSFYNTPPANYDNHYAVSSANVPNQLQQQQRHHQAQTPPESVSPKSSANASGGGGRGSNNVSALSPHSVASNTSSLSSAPSSATAVQQQQLQQPQHTAQRPSNKRPRHGGYETSASAAKQNKCNAIEQTYANSVVPNLPSSGTSSTAFLSSTTSVLPTNHQYPPPPPSSVQDFDQYSSFDGCGVVGDGDLRSLTENPIRFQPYLTERWEPLYDQNVQPIEFTTYSVDAEKGFNYSMYDQVHVCQKKNHFQITCQFQTSAPPCFVGNPLPLDLNRARILDIHLNMYGIKLDAPDQKVRLQQSKADRTKQDFQPLLITGLGEMNNPRQQLANMSGDLTSSLMCQQQQYCGVKLNVGRLHFADTTMNNMRKKGKPNRSQQYFALVVELNARDVEGNTRTLLAMVSDKCIVRASNPGQFESNLDVTWLKSPNGPDSVFHQGKVGINVEKPTEALEVRGNIKIIGGHLLNPSDERIKTDIQPLDPREQLANVTKMKVYKYRYKDGITQALGLEDEHGEFHEIGFLAQEVAAIIPDAVEISGDLTLVNGETIENLLVVNKERVFIDTVAAVGELNRVLDEVVGRLERMERTKPKNRSSLSRSDSLRSITSSVTQISQRLRLLVPSDDLSSHYGYITANSRRIVEAQPPLNEADEDEEENRSAKTTKTTVDFDGSTLSRIDSMKKCADALNNRLSLSSSSTRTTDTFAETWRNNEFDKAHSLVLPTRKKALAQLDSNSSNASSVVDDEKSSNFYVVCHRPKCSWWLSSRWALFLATLLCVALFSGLLTLVLVFYQKSTISADHGVASNALVYTSSSSRSVWSDEELLRQYKMLPKMLNRTQAIEQCRLNTDSSSTNSAATANAKCAQQYDQYAPDSRFCCVLYGDGTAKDYQRDYMINMGSGRVSRHRTFERNQKAATVDNANFPTSVAPNIFAHPPTTSYFHAHQKQASSLAPSLKSVAADMPTRESPRVIVDAPPQPPPRWIKRRDVSQQTDSANVRTHNSSEFANDFLLYIPSLNVTVDHTYCALPVDSHKEENCKTKVCSISIPLRSDFPLVALEVTLHSTKDSVAQHAMDLCEFTFPLACTQDFRIGYQQKTNPNKAQKTWVLPVGYYVNSSYKFVIAEGDFRASLKGACSLPSLEGQQKCLNDVAQNKIPKKSTVIDLKFKRICA